MRKIVKIAGNELMALFCSPIAWFILVIFAFQAGVEFANIFKNFLRVQYLGDPGEHSITAGMLTGMFGLFTKIQSNLYLYIPLLTMGLMSRELSSGSIKLLYSSPIKASQIIWGKFLSMMIYGLALIGILLLFMLFSWMVIPSFDISLAISGLLGLYLLVCAYASIGLYMSCHTSYQVVAAMGTLAVLIVLNFIGSVGQDIAFVREITYWLSIRGRASIFVNGLICSEDLLYFLIVILFFLTIAVMKVESHRAKRSKVMTITRYLVVVILVVASGYLTSRPTLLLYKDMTACQTETLAKESQEILEQLDGELEITTYVNLLGLNYAYGLPKGLKSDMEKFKPYIRFKPDIKLNYEYYYLKAQDGLNSRFPGLSDKEIAQKFTDLMKLDLDLFQSPEEIAQKIDLSGEGYRFVRHLKAKNGNSTFLRLYQDQMIFPTETETAAALKRLVQTAPVVACLTGHGERDMHGVGDRDYYSFAKNQFFRYALVNHGFDVISYQLEEGKEIPEEIDILVIADLKHPLSIEQKEQIMRYISRGGNLLIAGEPGRQEVMNPLLECLGIQLMSGVLVEPSKDFQADLVQCVVTDTAVQLSKEYARMRRRKEVVTMPGCVGIELQTVTDFEVKPILMTQDSGSWNELETSDLINDTVVLNALVGEQMQAFPTVLALRRQIAGKEQRVVVFGDADCISNAELMMTRKGIKSSNYSLITESFRWLSRGEYPVLISHPDPKDVRIDLPLSAAKWIKMVVVGILPLLLIGCGVWVWYKRRGR